MNKLSIVKSVLCCLLAMLICCGTLCSCANQSLTSSIVIPDVERLDMETAKTLLAGKGLIPKVEYEYNNDYDYEMVIRTDPAIGTEVSPDTPVKLYICKGPSYYSINDAVGWLGNVEGIEDFVWAKQAPDGKGTKYFYNLYAQEGFLYITVELHCKSKYDIEFYGDFGTASISDTFDKTVPIKLIYDSQQVNNTGEATIFELKIPLTDLGVQKPTNIYVDFDFLVNHERQTFKAGFDLTW